MTREEAKELSPLIQAFAEGKKIEYSVNGKNWSETERPIWNNYHAYRIKPEPKYRPFKSKEECWNEMKKHEPFGWIVGSIEYHSISSVSDVHIWLDDKSYFTFEDAFNNFNFADGMPFGIKEELV